MRTKRLTPIMLAVVVTVALYGRAALAQTVQAGQGPSGQLKTDSKMAYHNGPIMSATADVYLIWYGCWDDTCGNLGNTTTQAIVSDFLQNVGGSPYFQINAAYANNVGQAPSGALVHGGSVYDRYSHGLELTAADIAGIAEQSLLTNQLPQDPSGIYVVIGSADVSSVSTGLCVPAALPHHGIFTAFGSQFRYAFVGNPNRCPTVAAPQFFSGTTELPTPNANLPADAMASMMAQLLSRIVTNPTGGAWYDRYGLENASKCVGQFGPTWATANGARANLKLGGRDYLIQQNWVLARKEHCAMNSSL